MSKSCLGCKKVSIRALFFIGFFYNVSKFMQEILLIENAVLQLKIVNPLLIHKVYIIGLCEE